MPTDLRATYRLQLNRDFGFESVTGVLGYLDQLGISHVYSSPQAQAATGSTHGYDVVDHSRVWAEIGGEPGQARMIQALVARKMGLILDVVPNHMAVWEPDNRQWWDVLARGRDSPFAAWFDIEWDTEAEGPHRILVPILGDQYGRELDARRVQLKAAGEEVVVTYFEHRFPVAWPSGRPWPDAPELERLNRDSDALHALLEVQHYRLAHWKMAARALDYRRFFDINSLVGIRIDRPEVFAAVHAPLLKLVRAGQLDGLRIDHIDGLREPAAYLSRLRGEAGAATWIGVEKILQGDEELPDWPVEGTTGYEFMNQACRLLVAPGAERPLTETYRRLTGNHQEWADIAHAARLEIMDGALASDVIRLSHLFTRIAEQHRSHRDHPRAELHGLITAFTACLPVYRTYLNPGSAPASTHDLEVVAQAAADTRVRHPEVAEDLLDFWCDLLVGRHTGPLVQDLVLRYQQLTGPVMAKGVEDTALYRYNRLVALNEVGGDPAEFWMSAADYHERRVRDQARPRTLLALSTHDTKRGADVRARICSITDQPAAWSRFAERALNLADEAWAGSGFPANLGYLLLQNLVGSWPISPERFSEYALKAAREARQETSWLNPDPDFEARLQGLAQHLCTDPGFRDLLEEMHLALLLPGRVRALAQCALKLTCPGVPDTYQGEELWDLVLVDPDNRRPIDFGLRSRLLGRADRVPASALSDPSDPGLPKLRLLQTLLDLRRRRPQAFSDGTYEPLSLVGEPESHLAYLRGDSVIVVIPTSGEWPRPLETALQLPSGRWQDVLTGASHSGSATVGRLLQQLPVAVMEKL